MTDPQSMLSRLQAKSEALLDAAVEIRWERLNVTDNKSSILKSGRAWNPRTNEDLEALYKGYKKYYGAAVAQLSQLEQHRTDIKAAVESQNWTPSQLQQLRVEWENVNQRIRGAKEGVAYLEERMRFWEGHRNNAGNDPVDIQSAYPHEWIMGSAPWIASGLKLNRFEQQLLPAGAHQLSKKRLQDMTQEAEKIRDIARYESKQKRRILQELRRNRADNEHYWRRAQSKKIDTHGYVTADRQLAAEIQTLQDEIHQQNQRAKRAERLIRDLKTRLRRGQFSAASIDHNEDALTVGVSLVPRKLRRLRKKHQGSSHERSAKKEARKARKARQDEIRLREAPLKQKEKELSRELKQAKRRERDIIKKRRKIRREQKKLRKQRRRAGKKKIVAASLNDMDPSIPSRVVSHLIQTGDLLSMDAPKTHHQARAEESFDRASESLLALTHAAMGSYPVLESGNHWLDDEVFGDDDDDDAIVYVDDDDVETFDQVPPQAQQGLMDWLDAWLDGFRPAPSDSRVYHRPRAVFAYAGEQMAKILAQHPNAIQNGLVDAWHDVHDAFTEMMEHVRHQQRIQAIPNPSSSSAMPAVSQKRVRTVVAKTHESRLKAIDALNRWAKSF